MTWKRAIVALVALLVGGILFSGGVAVGFWMATREYRADRPAPPAPSAPKAPDFKTPGKQPETSADPKDDPVPPEGTEMQGDGPDESDPARGGAPAHGDLASSEGPGPAYQWPEDFKLPLKIVIEVPELPEQFREP
jgi:hypothetical protein